MVLLVLLRDKAGLKYKDINDICVFSNLSFSFLRVLYRRTKNKKKIAGPEIDKRNRNKKRIKEPEEKAITKVDKNRRLQPYDANAPISARQMKKRKMKEVKGEKQDRRTGEK